MPLPNLLVLGAQKAGTTSLHHYLGQHPRVFMSPLKEPGYFAWLDWMEAGGPVEDEAPIGTRWRGGLAALAPPIRDRTTYEALFASAAALGAGAAIGESSTDSLCSPGAAARAAELIPEARCVVLLRQPADRAYSNWLHAQREGREPLEFLDALDAEAARIDAGWGPMWRYAEKSRYAPQLRPWLSRFPGRVHVELSDDLAADPAAVCGRIVAFLGLEPYAPDVRERYHVGAAPSGRRAEGQLHRALVALGARVPWSYRRRIRDALFPRRTIDPALQARITRDRFLDDIAQTSELVGRDLSGWLPRDP